MNINVVILTKSSKYKKYCVAGIDIDTGKWVRLVSSDSESHGALSYQNIRYADGTAVNVLDKVKVNILDFKPSATQPENVLIDESKHFIKKGTSTIHEVLEIHPPEEHKTILGNDSYYVSPSDIGIVKHSLVLIKVNNVSFNWWQNSYGKDKLKMNFFYNGKYYSNISVTDPDYYQVQDNLTIQSAILVISLPDDDWSSENGYYKFVAKIFH
ncbi:MAG: hypothetical protein BWY74_00052 [Firmicutes bacterium ADurb.Bin419]|nr:MAG: hypothetical protein BWY74_00052 [Firmicutes bacterium ADurb.Bin419]